MLLGLWVVSMPTQQTARQVRLQIDEADFAAARRTLVAAEARPDLKRDEYVELLELRALIHLAFGESEPLQKTLRRLAALDYNRRFSPRR